MIGRRLTPRDMRHDDELVTQSLGWETTTSLVAEINAQQKKKEKKKRTRVLRRKNEERETVRVAGGGDQITQAGRDAPREHDDPLDGITCCHPTVVYTT